jgi:hypothetical protein
MKKLIYTVLLILIPFTLIAQNSEQPLITIQSRKILDYERPPRLKEEDNKNGVTFQFVPGLEIVTDLEYVKVYIFDIETGRTPFESNNIQNGSIRIKLEKPGFPNTTFWVMIKDGFRTTVSVSYLQTRETENPVIFEPAEKKSSPLYLNINPEDPGYYRQLFYLNDSDLNLHKTLLLIDEAFNTEMILSPQSLSGAEGAVFSWNGLNAEDKPVADGVYTLQISPDEKYLIGINRKYSRRSTNYYSGFAGLALVPSARILFPGGFQFGSTISLERTESDSSLEYNLPFSFFLRSSPLKMWETAFEAETSFITEDARPSLRLNSSQKVFVFESYPLQISIGLRGSYKSAINDFSEQKMSSLVRDPTGLSFYIPFQYKLPGWDLYASPEILFSLHPLLEDVSSNKHDYYGVIRWGIQYSTDVLFSVGISSSLYFPSYRGSTSIMQAGLEGTFFIPETPMYLNLYTIMQKVHRGERGSSQGFNLGFLL